MKFEMATLFDNSMLFCSSKEDVGAVLGIGSKKGDVILLDGDLGAG